MSMKNLFVLLLLLPFFLVGQTTYTEQVCETQTAAGIGDNRNEFLHNLSPPTVNTGYQHDFSPVSVPASCGIATLTNLVVTCNINNITDNTDGTTCDLFGFFVDVFVDCGGTCPVNQSVNGGCNSWNSPIITPGSYSLDLMICPGNPVPDQFSTINVDVMPAMDFGGFPNCPCNTDALTQGKVDISYTLCIDYTFTLPDPPTAVASNPGPFCEGGDIFLEADGGVSYAWSGPNGFNSSDQNPIIPNASINDQGIYTVVVTDANGCDDMASTTVTIGSSIDVMIVSTTDPTCFALNNGSASISVSGGDGSYSYNWVPNGFSGPNPTNLEGGVNYEIEVTDGAGCTGSEFITLFEPPPVELILDFSQDPSCPGGTDGVAAFTASGGNGGPFTYLWDPDNYDTPIVRTLSGGIQYQIIATDSEGCQGSETVFLSDGSPINITFTEPGPYCLSNDSSRVQATPVGGTWSGNVSPEGYFLSDTLGAGTFMAIYTLTNNGCNAVDTVDFIVRPPIPITFGDSIFCETSTSEMLTASPSGGEWANSGININGQINPSTLGVGNHTFTYSIMSLPDSCISSKNITVTIQAKPDAEITGDLNFCESAGNQAFTGSPTGGTWGGVANTSGQVDANSLSIGTHTITYEVTDGKCTDTQTETLTVTAAPTATLSGNGDICPGGNNSVDLEITTTGTPPLSIVFAVDGTPQIPVNINSTPFQFTVSQAGTYTLVSVTDDSGCVGTVSGSGVVNSFTPLSISNIQSNCDATNTNYTFSFEISGGNPSTYVVNGVTGTLSGNTFTSDPIPASQTSNYTVTDNSGCLPISDMISVNCACITEVGFMSSPTLNICGSQMANATYNNANENLDGNDIVQFVLHTNSGINLGTVIATNSTPDFNFDATNMTFGTTYYISAIAGNDSGGNVDLTDPCLKVAAGTPVTFREIPTAEITGDGTLCIGDDTDLTINLSGEAPWTVQYTDGTTTFDLNGINSSPFILNVNPSTSTTYELVSVNNNFCPGTVSGRAKISVFDTPTVSNVEVECDNTNTQYTVTFEINNGDIDSYNVTGSGTLSGNIFTSDFIPSGDGYSFTVSDDNQCGQVVVEAQSFSCSCDTEVGNLTGSNLDLCIGEIANLTHDGNENLDPNDVLIFVLHDGSATSLGTILMSNSTPDFTFNNGILTAGTRYAICALAGNDSGNNMVDLTDPCLSISNGFEVTWRDLPTAQFAGDQTICEGDASNLILQLSGAGTFDVTINDGTTDIFLTGISDGHNFPISPTANTTYSITNVSDNNCQNTSSSTALVTVNITPFADVTAADEVCNSTSSGDPTTIDFSGLLTGGNLSGTWVDLDNSGATGTFPNLNFDGVTPGDYTFEYTTNSADAPCLDVTYPVEITVRDCDCPSVSTSPGGPLCSDNGMLNLDDLKLTTEAGIWTITDSPMGSTATLSGNNFDATNSSAGDYTLEFTISTIPPSGCPTSSQQTIQVVEPPFATVSAGAQVCNTDVSGDPTTFDFRNVISAGDTNGSWTDLDNSGATGTFPMLEFDGVLPGDYTFEYTTNSATAPCGEATYQFELTVRDCACPSVATTGGGPLCNDNATLDLDDLTITTESGSWSIMDAPAGSAATLSGNNFDATNSPAGDYTLEFTLSTAPPTGCPASSTQVISVVGVVSAGSQAMPLRLCNDGSSLNLIDELAGAATGGTWNEISATPAGANFANGILDLTNLPEGTYEFRYEVSAQAPCSNDMATVTVEVNDELVAGDLLQNLSFCESKDTLINLFSLIENFDLGGVWTDISSTPSVGGFDATNATFSTSGQQSGNYQFEYAFGANGNCPASNVVVEIQLDETPVADAGDDITLNCDMRMANFASGNSTSNPNMIYAWTGGTVSDPDILSPEVSAPGIYTLVVENRLTGCSSTDEVEVFLNDDLPILSATSVEITCFGDGDGVIEIDDVDGGTGPFMYSINGGTLSDQNTFSNLTAGSYTVMVEDANGCTDELDFTITEPNELNVTLEVNFSTNSNAILLGDSAQLIATVSAPFDSLAWSPEEAFVPCDPETDPDGCLVQWVQPQSVTTYSIVVIDDKGCSDRSSVTVQVERGEGVFVPGAFSPNDDGINDIFEIFTDQTVAKINQFMVFDRWGNAMFSASEFEPNQSVGWDGKYKGKKMNSAVYVFFAEIEYTSGENTIFEGEVTLLR